MRQPASTPFDACGPNLQASFVIGRLHGVRSLAEAQPLG
jgi:hypothetical protein